MNKGDVERIRKQALEFEWITEIGHADVTDLCDAYLALAELVAADDACIGALMSSSRTALREAEDRYTQANEAARKVIGS